MPLPQSVVCSRKGSVVSVRIQAIALAVLLCEG